MEKEKRYNRQLKDLAILLDAISHPVRLQIIEHPAKYDECYAVSISKELPICKSTVLQHMNK